MMTAPAEARPYHHGDLRRALVDAARRILENEGLGALSLRAVAREAGVSPAAPYHHFKDKGELLEAVALEGWEALSHVLADVRAKGFSLQDLMVELGVAYTVFARDNPALYRVMYDAARDKDALPDSAHDESHGAYFLVRNTLNEAAGGQVSDMDLELATIAAWSSAHGMAELSNFKQFDHLKQAFGEEGFLRAVFQHVGMFARIVHR